MPDPVNDHENPSSSKPGKTNTTSQLQKAVNKYSSTIWGLILSGVGGFVLAVYLLLGWPFNNKNRFHEIDIHTTYTDSIAIERLTEILTKQLHQVHSDTEKNAAERILIENVVGKRTPSDANTDEKERLKKIDGERKQLEKRIDSIKNLLKELELQRFGGKYGNFDTLSFEAKANYTIRLDKLEQVIEGTALKGSLEYGYHNDNFSDESFTINSPVTIKDYPMSFAFFRKYPNFAFWVFIWILQMVAWLLILPICLFLYGRIKELNNECETENRRGKSLLFAGISLAVFGAFLYLGILDQYIITDKFFMRGFSVNLFVYALIGYFVAFLCLAGYLYIADFLHQLQLKYKEASAVLSEILTNKKADAGANEAALVAIEKTPEVQNQRQEISKIKERFQKAKKYFNLFLWMCAVVLSMLVLCTASLFHSINSLEVFSFYKYLSGRSFLSDDLVYLYGGLHSIILLIFVLPARFKMMDMSMSIPELQEEEKGEAGNSGNKILKGIGATLVEVLVVSSPLLASIIQNVVNSWFN